MASNRYWTGIGKLQPAAVARRLGPRRASTDRELGSIAMDHRASFATRFTDRRGKEQSAIQMERIRSSVGRRLGKQHRRQLRVLYQDDAVVVLNKPAKMLAVPADDSDLPSALSLLSAELESKRQRAFVVHRIDRQTSGILLFAKTWPDREALVQQVYPTHPGEGISRSSSRSSPVERRDTRSLLSATRNVSKGDHRKGSKIGSR